MGTSLLSAQQLAQINDGGEDRISELHETVLCDILSRLPLKDVVRTSILSKDWEYKWTSLDIDHLERLSQGENLDIVGRVHFSQDFKSFSLLRSPEAYYSTQLVTLLSGALMRNLESFQLVTGHSEGFVLPRSLVNNASLTHLKLRSSCIFKVPLDNCFQNLTSLELCYVEILNKVSNSDRLVFYFPVLKTFELMNCKWSNVNLVEIYSPSLSTFVCHTSWNSDEAASVYSIKICGARLEKFVSFGGTPENIVFYESVVLNAHIDCNYNDALRNGMRIIKLFNGFSSTITSLRLSDRVSEAIAKQCMKFRFPSLACYNDYL